MIKYNTSYRCRSIEETLGFARQLAKELGIVRVTETTWLDRIGIPVFTSVRPDAHPSSLCVNSGKGFTQQEAKVGAYMEAIEFAMAEPHQDTLDIHVLSPYEIYDGATRIESLLDLCPNVGVEIDLEKPIQAVETIEMNSGEKYMMPASLVFFPFPKEDGFDKIYGSSTNGLSSGNSKTEALIHGLFEVVERHVLSFHLVQDNTQLIELDSLPPHFDKVKETLKREGLDLVVRYAPNELEIPVFLAYVIDPSYQHPMFINVGHGCHINKEIALSRAIAEAIQSRLVLIHGARDDIPQSHKVYEGLSAREMQLNFQNIDYSLKNAGEKEIFENLLEYQWEFEDLEDYYQQLLDLLRHFGFPYVMTIAFTPKDSPLHVMRTIIPKMEFFNSKSQRLGPLLKAYATEVAHQTVRGTESE